MVRGDAVNIVYSEKSVWRFDSSATSHFQFQSSSMVEHAAVGHKVLFNRECKSHKAKVNRRVGGSKPSSGALYKSSDVTKAT